MAKDRHATNSTRRRATPLGLPDSERLTKYRIWDCYFTPAHSHPGRDGSERLIAEIQRSVPAIKLGCFERLCYFAHVGIGTTGDAQLESRLRSNADLVELPLKRYPKTLMAMIQLNGHDVNASLDAIDRWLADGLMIGVYLPGGGAGAVNCTHPNIDRLVCRVAELRGLIIQHTWFKTGGKQGPGESTPAELAELARRYPEQPFICAHAGGEWERGLRAVRREPNVLVETSGFDSTAGFMEMAVREVGARRILFGSHLPSRSLGTELAKVTAANVSETDKRLILGENFRQLIRSRTL
jgi:predicted TIM-barrel fold metal-dependent hydrolase